MKKNLKSKTKRARHRIQGGKMSHTLKCGPKGKNGNTCYSNDNIIKLKTLWNNKNPSNQIHSNTPEVIHNFLTKNINNCNNDYCWLNQDFVNDKKTIFKEDFAPIAPDTWKTNPTAWLSNIDILHVLQQYEKVYKCFKFIGPSPIDFYSKYENGQCIWKDICTLDIHKLLKEGKNKIGFVFNTDPHDEDGEHWISLFVNLKKKEIYFFDSVGNEIPKEINTLVSNIKKQGSQMVPPILFNFKENTIKHQSGDTECGVYSLYFIIHMIKDSAKKITTKKINDLEMKTYRNVYFNIL